MAEKNSLVSRAIEPCTTPNNFCRRMPEFHMWRLPFRATITRTSYLLDLAIAFSHLACVRAVSDDNYRWCWLAYGFVQSTSTCKAAGDKLK